MTLDQDTIERLQSKIAFLERANSDLSDVVYRQQQELDALGQRIAAIAERLTSTQLDEPMRSSEDERPPHY